MSRRFILTFGILMAVATAGLIRFAHTTGNEVAEAIEAEEKTALESNREVHDALSDKANEMGWGAFGKAFDSTVTAANLKAEDRTAALSLFLQSGGDFEALWSGQDATDAFRKILCLAGSAGSDDRVAKAQDDAAKMVQSVTDKEAAIKAALDAAAQSVE